MHRPDKIREPDIEFTFDDLTLYKFGIAGLNHHPWAYATYELENRVPKGKRVVLATHFPHYDSMRYTVQAWLEDE